MNEAEDYGRFANALGTMAALFRFDVGAAAPAYWAGCRRISIEDFEAACVWASEKSEHMPVPVQLLKFATQAKMRDDGKILIASGEWVDGPFAATKRPALPGKVRHERSAPPLPTYAECIASCQLNMDAAIERARYATDPNQPWVQPQALADVAHWREMRVWYEKQVAEGRGGERIRMGGFVPAGGQAPSQQPAAQPEQHWSEGREPGSDDDELTF